jgi:hypothetical protein
MRFALLQPRPIDSAQIRTLGAEKCIKAPSLRARWTAVPSTDYGSATKLAWLIGQNQERDRLMYHRRET